MMNMKEGHGEEDNAAIDDDDELLSASWVTDSNPGPMHVMSMQKSPQVKGGGFFSLCSPLSP